MIAIKPAAIVRNEMWQDREYLAEIKEQASRVMRQIETAKTAGRTRTCFSPSLPYRDEVKKMFADKGYTFKPTGYCGGVWQLTEDICWD